MNILAVDTAGKTAGVALLQDDRLLYEVYLDGGMTHSETLMPMIDTCLKMCGMTCADIDLYGVNAGPGSFTGLRIGLAAVKGLAFPRETLCAPVSTLEALAAAHTGEGTVLCALDARRAQIILGGNAVQVKMCQRSRPAVIVHDGKGGAGHRVGAAKPLRKALGESGLARAKPAGKGHQRARCQCAGHACAQRHGLGTGVGDIFRHEAYLIL